MILSEIVIDFHRKFLWIYEEMNHILSKFSKHETFKTGFNFYFSYKLVSILCDLFVNFIYNNKLYVLSQYIYLLYYITIGLLKYKYCLIKKIYNEDLTKKITIYFKFWSLFEFLKVKIKFKKL